MLGAIKGTKLLTLNRRRIKSLTTVEGAGARRVPPHSHRNRMTNSSFLRRTFFFPCSHFYLSPSLEDAAIASQRRCRHKPLRQNRLRARAPCPAIAPRAQGAKIEPTTKADAPRTLGQCGPKRCVCLCLKCGLLYTVRRFCSSEQQVSTETLPARLQQIRSRSILSP